LWEFYSRMVQNIYRQIYWPPNSPDLTFPDSPLWGFAKNELHVTPLQETSEN
jgi:hypothetical protein